MPSLETAKRENLGWLCLFGAALAFNIAAVAYHFTMGFMSGHEFRQAQTAINTYYIDEQNNFSLLYETPVLGKPWVSILLEVPIYEWSVVGLSRATGLSHVVAARTISVTCFYLMLPALWLLLGRLAVPRPRRLLVLALVLTAPVYIYYSRAFLMDAMALMCCVWFLLGFVRTMDERRWSWLALTIVAGTLAALIKSATLVAWLIPAAAYGAWMLWRDLRARAGWAVPVKTVLWGAATIVVALGSLKAWVAYTDPIKAAHASAWIFTSKNLTQGNWGLFDPRPLFSRDLWRQFFACWAEAIMSPWLIGLGLVGGLLLPTVRWRVLGVGSLFFLAQFAMPFAFAYQDYYYYSCAVFVDAALGLTLLGLLDSRVPRWCCVLVLLVPFGAQVRAYWQTYLVGQKVVHQGGYPFTDVIRELTPKKSVIIVAGADWAAMAPLYAQRKALMVRNGLEYDSVYLKRAFDDLAGEDVSALIVYGPLRQNRDFIKLVGARFNMDIHAPTFFFNDVADVYVSDRYARGIQVHIKNSLRYTDIRMPPSALTEPPPKGLTKIPEGRAREAFVGFTPAPYQVNFHFGMDWIENGSEVVLSAHPDSDLWIDPPAGATRIVWGYGIFPGAYAKPGSMTDGVEFIVETEAPDGQTRRLYRRLLDPVNNPADRGDQHVMIPYTPQPGAKLRFSTRPFETTAFDWAYIIGIRVE